MGSLSLVEMIAGHIVGLIRKNNVVHFDLESSFLLCFLLLPWYTKNQIKTTSLEILGFRMSEGVTCPCSIELIVRFS